ncbi:hypothetical protein [Nannocystis bainbridge]|uniref:Uncharacterized protein n=1 Tax=Nannocystis bainbridge TaxID=2995303 RepID=A0ABT5E602_9BACT|nr:hypothetical protein [Nannocystis bainbridge]MDC0721287.1 hypothetical protein [Nannocystis bainbridge]
MAQQCIDPALAAARRRLGLPLRVLTAIGVTGMLACGHARGTPAPAPPPVVEPEPDPPWGPPPPPPPPRAAPGPRVEHRESSWTVEERSTTTETHMRVEAPEPEPEPEPEASPAGACCRMCHKGKACGNTCIARDKTCRTPPGCACDE